MLLSNRIKLPLIEKIRGKVPNVLFDFLFELCQDLQEHNKKIIDAMRAGTKSGTLVIDDGTNRCTLVFKEGKLKDVTIAASSAQTMSWTED